MIKHQYLLLGALLSPVSAHAVYDYSWTFSSSNTSNCVNSVGTANSCDPITTRYTATNTSGTTTGVLDSTKASGGDSAYVAGADGNGKGNNQTFNASTASSPTVNASGFSTQGTGYTFDTATLALYSGGLGVSNASDGNIGISPDHAFDNDGSSASTTDTGPEGNVDAGLFKFSSAVVLNSITAGWISGDADVSVLRYTGSATPVVPTGTLTSLLTNGWEFIGDYQLALNSAVSINSQNKSSSYWLVTAFTSVVSPTSSTTYLGTTAAGDKKYSITNPGSTVASTFDFGNDYFKIAGLTANQAVVPPSGTPVPEPTSLLLFGIGVLGWRFNRKNTGLTIEA